MLKAVLGSLGITYRFTHNLGELIRLLEVNGHPLPAGLGRLRDLTPYATEWRYDFVPPEGDDDIDLKPHREMVRELHAWVKGLLSRAS
jgi:HEPN domain-containing protein